MNRTLHDDFGAFTLALEAIPVIVLKYPCLSSLEYN
jgi:hypothetical protein